MTVIVKDLEKLVTRAVTSGVVRAIGVVAFGVLVLSLLAKVFYDTPKDDTDPVDGRSGLSIYTDHSTGCQYLSVGAGGGLTPRLNSDGVAMCGRQRDQPDILGGVLIYRYAAK